MIVMEKLSKARKYTNAHYAITNECLMTTNYSSLIFSSILIFILIEFSRRQLTLLDGHFKIISYVVLESKDSLHSPKFAAYSSAAHVCEALPRG